MTDTLELMNWVVLGDIGRSDYYHLGDEAMTEVAVEMLVMRGATNVTLVASDPGTARDFYGQDAVQRPLFEWFDGRERWEQQLLELESVKVNDQLNAIVSHDWVLALKNADFALIAGGGNMNSQYAHLLYERVAFARIAKKFGVPLFISSQTVGPILQPRDVELVSELLSIAVCFGAREAKTAEFLRGLTDRADVVVHTFDDAILLSPTSDDRKYVNRLGISDPVLVASFTEDQGTSGIRGEEYVSRLAQVLDTVAIEQNLSVILAPHAGVFGASLETRDQVLNRRVAELSTSGKVIPAPMPTAREYVALVEVADCVFSSRYHSLVFASQAEVAAVGLSLSTYSSVRMRGALANVGQERFVVPSLLWDQIEPSIAEAIRHNGRRPAVAESSMRFQHSWWDALVKSAKSGKWMGLRDLPASKQVVPQGTWSTRVEAATPAFELWGEETLRLSWAEKELQEWQQRAIRAENRRSVRMIDAFSRWVSK